MNERERTPDEFPGSGHAGAPGPAGHGQMPQLRRQADDLLAEGDAIIRAALSSDTEAFLRAAQQQGGE